MSLLGSFMHVPNIDISLKSFNYWFNHKEEIFWSQFPGAVVSDSRWQQYPSFWDIPACHFVLPDHRCNIFFSAVRTTVTDIWQLRICNHHLHIQAGLQALYKLSSRSIPSTDPCYSPTLHVAILRIVASLVEARTKHAFTVLQWKFRLEAESLLPIRINRATCIRLMQRLPAWLESAAAYQPFLYARGARSFQTEILAPVRN